MPPHSTLRFGSQGPETRTLQHLLNLIPNTLLPRLIEDGLFGRKTLERVREFQKNAKLVVDGVVGPQSWGMLDELTRFLLPLPPGTMPPGTLGAWRNEPFRETVIKIALAEALPVSKVTDFIPLPPVPPAVFEPGPVGPPPTRRPSSWRFGWQRLKQYFEESSTAYTPLYWRQTGPIMMNNRREIIMNLDGVRGQNWRVPQYDANLGGLQWCGMFATWCWIKAGVPTRWPPGGPPIGIKKRWVYDRPPPPKPGDMLVQRGQLSHHCLLLPDDVGPNLYLAVHGNSDYQSVSIKPIERTTVAAIYSLEDFIS